MVSVALHVFQKVLLQNPRQLAYYQTEYLAQSVSITIP